MPVAPAAGTPLGPPVETPVGDDGFVVTVAAGGAVAAGVVTGGGSGVGRTTGTDRGGSPVPYRQPSTSPSWTRTEAAPARE